MTLDEVVCVLRKQIRSSRTAVWRFFQRHKITFKKSLRAAEQERPDVARARRRWMRAQGLFDPAHLVFLDETAANTKMMRLGGRCLRGDRLIRPGSARPLENDNLRRRSTLQGMTAPYVIDGAMKGRRSSIMWSTTWLQLCGVTTPWSWTTFRHTRQQACAKRLKRVAPSFVICRNIPRI